jgi:hypothetical protein
VAIVEGIQCSPDDHFEAFFVMLYVIEVTIWDAPAVLRLAIRYKNALSK